MAHARRKFFELHTASKSQLAEQALHHIGQLYEVERQVKDLDVDARRRIRQERAKPLADALRLWMQEQRARAPDGSATAKAFYYSLKRWSALTRYLDDGQLPIDNITSNGRSGRLQWAGVIGCSRDPCVQASGRQL